MLKNRAPGEEKPAEESLEARLGLMGGRGEHVSAGINLQHDVKSSSNSGDLQNTPLRVCRREGAVKEQDSCSEHTINQPKALKATSQRTSPSEFITVITAAFCQSLLFPKLQHSLQENQALKSFPLRFMVHSGTSSNNNKKENKKGNSEIPHGYAWALPSSCSSSTPELL